MNFTHYVPTKIYFGTGISRQISDIIRQLPVKNIFIVTGTNIRSKTPILHGIIKQLRGYRLSIFSEVVSNPDIYQVAQCMRRIVQTKAQCVIGLGGGSVLDLAKAAALLISNPGRPEEYFLSGKEIHHTGLPVVAIPTTAGTSSEITPFSVITFPERKSKITLNHNLLYPVYALVDPLLCIYAPRMVSASSGLDVLSHAFEAYWNKRSTPFTDLYAVEAIRIVFKKLVTACKGIGKKRSHAVEQMCLAALYAGFSFSQTKTTGPHAVSYPLTTLFGIPHGLACSLTLAEFYRFNMRALMNKNKSLMQPVNAKTPRAIARSITRLISDVGFKTKLRDYGITKSNIPAIIRHAYLPAKFKHNPCRINRQNLRSIITNIL
ncbi:MAG: iron-containing alcohol dehydrogenase [bacterium]